jgi:hypothetical protein
MSEVVIANMIDGFEGYEDRFEGGELQQASAGRVIQGTIVKFTNEAEWLIKDGAELSPDHELIAVDIIRVVQKWKEKLPVETIILEPGQKFPDVKKLNEETPQSEWVKGPDGQLRGPFQKQQIVYLLDPVTLDRFCWPTGTVGGDIAIRELVDKTKWMRKFRGGQVCPVVTLSDVFMNTGGRQRPHFIIKRWIALGGDEKPALAAPPSGTVAEPPKTEPLPGTKTVEGEQMNDEIPPFDDSPNIDVPKTSSPPVQPKPATPQTPPINKKGVQEIASGRR